MNNITPDRSSKICRGYLFVFCGSFFALTGRRGRRPLQEISNFLMRRSLFLVLFLILNVLFCVNRKERKESQTFRLIDVRRRFHGAIGSPTGVFAKSQKPPRNTRRWRKNADPSWRVKPSIFASKFVPKVISAHRLTVTDSDLADFCVRLPCDSQLERTSNGIPRNLNQR